MFSCVFVMFEGFAFTVPLLISPIPHSMVLLPMFYLLYSFPNSKYCNPNNPFAYADSWLAPAFAIVHSVLRIPSHEEIQCLVFEAFFS